MSHVTAKRRFTVDEYYRMAEAGIISADDRVELIEGEIIAMSPIGSRHAACVVRLVKYLSPISDRVLLWVQNPIRIGRYSEPEPDVVLLRPQDDFYATSHPTPGDVYLVIEVADTSVEYNRDTKLPLYAAAGIPEYVLINLPKDDIEHYAQLANGQYQFVRIIKRGEAFTSRVISGFTLSADTILG